jgi:YD repeat-containing protein
MLRALSSSVAWLARVFAACAITALVAGSAGAVGYTYDELGRLKSVTDAAGNSAEYIYDAVGNIVQIKQIPSGTLSITEFTPNGGPVGTSVTIFGGGFSATVASNVVKFNGTAAAITSAAVNKLVVTVPTGATTGNITVTVGTTTATSTDVFTVLANNGVPTITNISPTCAVPGNVIAVTGTNFDTTLNGTKVELGLSFPAATINSANAISMTVPTSTGSAKVRAVTANGIGTSASTLLIPPVGLTCTDVEVSTTVTASGAAQPINIATAGKYGVVFFNGSGNSYMSLQVSNYTSASSNLAYSVYGPSNALFTTGYVSASAPSMHLPKLPNTGTYSIIFNSGSSPASLNIKLENNIALVVNNAASISTIAAAGQSTRYILNVGLGAGLAVTGLAYTPTGNTGTEITVYKPDGSVQNNATCVPLGNGCNLGVVSALDAGTYSVVIAPPSSASSANFTILLSSPVLGALTLNSVSGTLITIPRIGQSARYTFNAALGANVGIGLTGLTYTPNTSTTLMTLLRPDGTALVSTTCSVQISSCSVDLTNASVAGTYTVLVEPGAGVSSASFTLLLSSPLSGAITVGSVGGIPVTLARPGQSARYSFTATAGQNLGLGLSDLVFSNTFSQANLTVYRSDGSVLNQTICYAYTGSCTLNMNNIAADTYNVVVSYALGATGSFKLYLNNDAVGTLSLNVATNVSLKQGQNARYTFSGTAGQSLGVELSQLVTIPNPSGRVVAIYVYRPTDIIALSGEYFSGSWQAVAVSEAGGSLSLPALPSTGTYTVIVDESVGLSATFALKLNAGIPLIVGAVGVNATTSAAGQNPRFTFDVALGATLGIGLKSLIYTPNISTTAMTLYQPDGTALTYATCYPSQNGCNIDLINAAVAGTYYVVIAPPPVVTATSFTMLLSSPVAGVFAIGSANPTSVALARAGQNARYTFTATAGQNLGIGLSDLSITPTAASTATMTVHLADNSILGTTPCNLTVGGCTLNLNNLVAGTYSVFTSLTQAATGSFKLQVNNDATGTLVANTVSNVSLKAGQNARYIFNGTAGQSVSIELTQLVTTPNPSGRFFSVYVYSPTDTIASYNAGFGGHWQSTSISGAGGTLALPALPATGTYTVIVDDSYYGLSSTFALKARSP